MITAWAIWGWFRRSLFAQIAAGVVAFLAIWQVNNYHQRSVGAQKERERTVENTQKVGRERNEQSQKVRKKAERPDSLKRLLDEHCRDCD
jgi:hypothetical protein